MVSFDTNILVYASAATPDEKCALARNLLARGMRQGSCVLLLQVLTEFSSVAIRKAGIPIADVRSMVNAWRGVLPVYAAEENDLAMALDAVETHQLAFWDALMWAAARRAGVRHMLTEDLQDGFVLKGVSFLNPFNRANGGVLDELLPP